MFVIFNPERRQYVARMGSEHSYTDRLQDAQVWNSEKQAYESRCDDELVMRVSDIMNRGAR